MFILDQNEHKFFSTRKDKNVIILVRSLKYIWLNNLAAYIKQPQALGVA